MTETRAVYTTNDGIYCEAINRLGVDRLAQLLKALDDIREETGYGAVEVVMQEGRIHRVVKKVNYQE